MEISYNRNGKERCGEQVPVFCAILLISIRTSDFGGKHCQTFVRCWFNCCLCWWRVGRVGCLVVGGLPGATLFTRQLCLAHKGVSQGMRGRCAFPLCLAGFCCYSSSMNGWVNHDNPLSWAPITKGKQPLLRHQPTYLGTVTHIPWNENLTLVEFSIIELSSFLGEIPRN